MKKPSFVPDEGIITAEMMADWSSNERVMFDRWLHQQLAKQIIQSMVIKAGTIYAIHVMAKSVGKKVVDA